VGLLTSGGRLQAVGALCSAALRPSSAVGGRGRIPPSAGFRRFGGWAAAFIVFVFCEPESAPWRA